MWMVLPRNPKIFLTIEVDGKSTSHKKRGASKKMVACVFSRGKDNSLYKVHIPILVLTNQNLRPEIKEVSKWWYSKIGVYQIYKLQRT